MAIDHIDLDKAIGSAGDRGKMSRLAHVPSLQSTGNRSAKEVRLVAERKRQGRHRLDYLSVRVYCVRLTVSIAIGVHRGLSC